MSRRRNRRKLLLETCEDRVLCSATPEVTLSVDGGADTKKIGENVTVTASFDNAGADPGYAPFIDVWVDKTGADGNEDNVGPLADNNADDGLTFNGATYLGAAVKSEVITVGPGGIAVYKGQNISAPSGYGEGDQLIVLELPFGSFTADQPVADVKMNFSISNQADLNSPLNLSARGRFELGATPLNDPLTDPPIVDGTYSNVSISPQLYTIKKVYLGPEDETATGPNFVRQYELQVEVAPGQTLTNLQLIDILASNVQYNGTWEVVTGGTASVISNPSTTVPGGTFSRQFASITGDSNAQSSPDAVVRFSFYVPRIDATGNAGSPTTGAIINPTTGDDVTSQNQYRTTATWDPIDPRDAITPANVDPSGPEHILTPKSIATQKGVTIVNDGAVPGLSPGDVLQYTISVQISDFFAFDQLTLQDIISDGQRLDTTFTPTFSTTEHGPQSIGVGGFNAANWTVAPNYTGATNPGVGTYIPDPNTAVNDGSTTLNFNISAEMLTRGQDGVLVGGGIPDGGVTATYSNNTTPFGGTTVTIVFRTVVQDRYSDPVLSDPNPQLSPRDVITNAITVDGRVLNVEAGAAYLQPKPGGDREQDTSGTSLQIRQPALVKTVYAINGVLLGTNATQIIRPGDVVTYRLQYTLPTGDIEGFSLTDYLPLPVFNTDDFNFTYSTTQNSMVGGTISRGPTDTLVPFLQANQPGFTIPTITEPGSNSVRIFFGDADSTANTPLTVDLLLNVTVNNQQFADGLYLTNQARATEGGERTQIVNTDEIVQVVVGQPVLEIVKGAVTSSNTGDTVFNVGGGLTFTQGAGLTGASSANALDTTAELAAIDAKNESNLDAGDVVTFAIVARNTGRADAFDVVIGDTISAGYVRPADAAALGATLAVQRGDGTLLTLGTDYTLTYNAGTGAFSVTLVDNYNYDASAGGAVHQGGINYGQSGVNSTDPLRTDGSNVLVITYAVQLATGVTPNATLTNTAALTNYSNSDGGTDITGTTDLVNSATVTTKLPAITKTLVGTEVNNAAQNNNNTQAVIGELVTYTVQVRVPEGTMNNFQVVDALPAGMAYVSVQSVSYSGGVNATTPINSGLNSSSVTNNGRNLTFNFGTVTNTDSNNATDEFITITYQAVVLNVSGNQGGTSLAAPAATLNYTSTDQPSGTTTSRSLTSVAPAAVSVIEPSVTLAKAVVVDPNGTPSTTGDAGDTVRYTLTVSLPGGSPSAFDVTLLDQLPPGLVGMAITLVTDTAGLVGAGDFNLAYNGGTDRYTLTSTANMDFVAGANRVVTIRVEGTIGSTYVPGQTVPNTAYVAWTSLDGPVNDRSTFNTTDSDERTGSTLSDPPPADALNDYRTSAAVNFTVAGEATKTIVSTSETHTATGTATATTAAVGEIVRFRLVTAVPEGGFTNLQFLDLLPAGLTYINGSARLGFVASSSTGITSSVAGIGSTPYISDTLASAVPTFVIPDANVTASSNPSTNDDGYAAGTDVYFNLGNITVSDRDPNVEYIVIEYNAVVANLGSTSNDTADGTFGGTDAGDINQNAFRVLTDGTGTTSGTQRLQSGNVNVTVVEPAVTLVKTVTTTPGDAGDQVVYQIVISNPTGTNKSTAFDLSFTDLLNLNITGVTVGTPTGSGFTGFSSAVLTGQGPGSNQERVNVTVTSLDVGGTITFTITGTLAATTPVRATISNTGDLTYTSLPGSGTAVNPTGTDPTTLTGVGFGERTGADGAAGLNDHVATSTTSFTLNAITAAKSLVGGDTTRTIGEIVTYQISVTVPDGVTTANGLVITDLLPAGLQYVSGSTVLNLGTFDGTVGTLQVVAAAGDGGDITFTFGSITANGGQGTSDNTFTFTFQAIVTDILANDGVGPVVSTLGNAAQVAYPGQTTTTTPPVNITLEEPQLVVTKAVSDASPEIGQTLTYTVTIAHTGDSRTTAFDVLFRDALPAGVAFVAGSLNIVLTSAAGTTTLSSSVTGNDISADFDQLLLGQTITITYQAVVSTSPSVIGTTQDNRARIYYDTLPGDENNAVLTGAADGTPDRDYGPQTTVEVHNQTTDLAQDVVRVTVNSHAISGIAYRDVNNNGVYDAGTDAPLSGVVLNLTGTDIGGNIINRQFTTAANGQYTFDLLAAGTYQIVETQPTGYLDARETVGTNYGGSVTAAFGAAAVNNTISNIVIADDGAATGTGYNFGEVLPSTLTGNVYLDNNNNGVRDGGEVGIANVDVTLTGTDAFGNAVNVTVQTDSNGLYTFSNLYAANGAGYTLTEDQTDVPATYLDGRDTVGTVNGFSSGALGGTAPVRDVITGIQLGQNATGANYNFGELEPSSLAGRVYLDLDRNNAYLAGRDTLLPGVTVTLTGTDDLNNPVSITTTTDANGAYIFNNLRPSNGSGYTITETTPAGYVNGLSRPGTPTGTAATDAITNIVILGGVNGVNQDFTEYLQSTQTKTIVSTSQASTTGSNVAVGEVVRYRLTASVPLGTLTDFQLRDLLPDGLQFLNNGTATVSIFGGATTTLTDAQISSSATLNQDNYGNGTDVFFKLGTITNTDTNYGTLENIVIEFDAVVTDSLGNDGVLPGQTTLSNQFNIRYDVNGDTVADDPTGVPDSPAVNVTVVEPQLQITKAVNDATPDINQTLTYTLTITHQATSTADAFDIVLRDLLPSNVTLNVGSIAVVGATITSNTSTGNAIALTLDGLANTPGATITITYTAVVNNTLATVGTTSQNNARLYWDSLPEDEANNSVVNNNTPDNTPDRDYGAIVGQVETPTGTTDPAQDTEQIVVNTNTISGYVYRDNNTDGDYDVVGDVTLSGVEVRITGTSLSGLNVDVTLFTDAGGFYQFTGLPPGTYTITETQPAGYQDGLETPGNVGNPFGGTVSNALNSNTITTITIPAQSNQSQTNYNFGEVLTSSLAGNVYLDHDNDGVRDAGEGGLGSVTITLTGTDVYGRTVNRTVQTNPDGTYLFDNLLPSNGTGYTVTEGVVTGTYFDGKDTVGSVGGTAGNDVLSAVVLAQNTNATGYNFGELVPSTLAGKVYVDLDRDGTFDTFDNSLPGVTVRLTGFDDLNNVVDITVTTNGTGDYQFTNLRPSNGAGYTITETQPANFINGLSYPGTPGGTAGTNTITGIVLLGNVNGTGNNFTEYVQSTLTKTIVSTSQGSTTGSNVAIGETVRYRLAVTVPYGTLTDFQVRDLLPAGLQFVNNGNATVSVFGGATTALTDAQISTSATANSDVYGSGTDVFFKLGTITNADTNFATLETVVIEFDALVLDEGGNEGVLPGQTTLSNEFNIRYDNTGDGTADDQTTIPNSTPVDVTVVEPQLQITKAVNDATPDINQTLTYTLTITHQATSTADAFDIVLWDLLPSNLTLNVGSIAVVGATITSNTSTGNAIALTLDGLANTPGATITITYTAVVNNTLATVGTTSQNNARLYWDSLPEDEANNSVVNNNTPDNTPDRDYGAIVGQVETPTGTTDPAQDTEQIVVNTNTITGIVYRDNNTDGDYDVVGDTPLSGVTVRLTGTTASNLPVDITTVTLADGSYSFSGLPPGTYLITETQPAGYVDGLETPGNTGNPFGGTVSSTIGSNTIATIVIPAQSNQTQTNYNFGEVLTSSVSGNVYLDHDNDGAIDAGETGLGAIDITLTGTDIYGQAVNITISTNPDGTYAFQNLRPSNAAGYTITEGTVPATYFDGKDTVGTIGGTPTGALGGTSPTFNQFTGVVLNQNQAGVSYNFGELVPSSVAGRVYLDLDRDGTFDTFDTALPGVTVTLTGVDDWNQTVSLTTVTDGSGNYIFNNLRPSNGAGYTITETQPANYVNGLSYVGTPGGTAGTNTITNVVLLGNVVGTGNNFTEYVQSTMTKTIVSTSQASTTAHNVAIGETVRYRLTASVPYGTLTDFQLRDILPPGLQFLNNGGATVSILGGATVALVDGQISTSATLNEDTYGSGTDVFFKLGTITNLDTDFSTLENIVIEFDALVLDVPANEGVLPGQTTLPNQFDIRYDSTGDGVAEDQPTVPSSPIDNDPVTGNVVTVVEPQLQISKSVSDTTPDINQTLTFTLTITHQATSTADAFDIILRDLLPTNLTLNVGSISVAGATLTSNTSTGNQIVLTMDGLANTPGATITITYTAVVNNSLATVGTSSQNNARIYWDSLPEDEPNNAVLNNTPDGTNDRDYGATNGVTELPGDDTDPAQDSEPIVVNTNTISGYVYRDNNTDGDYDVVGDAPLLGVTVRLRGTTASGLDVDLTTTTNAAGFYSFAGLPPGTYYLTETTPVGYVDALETVGTNFGGTVLATYGNEEITNIVIPAQSNTTGANYNFGEVLTSSIAGNVYLDDDNDGVRDAGETGVAGIPVTLTGVDVYGQNVILNGVTLANGTYSFANLRPGTYVVTEDDSSVVPIPYLDGRDTAGSVGGTVTGTAPKRDQISAITLAQNVAATGYNFGELRPAALSGTVYEDRDNDGTQDPLEAGIAGVVVRLVGITDTNEAVDIIVTTDGSGNYAFNNLRPGTYRIEETQPAAYGDGIDTPGTLGGTVIAPDTISQISVQPAQSGTGYNFGERLAGIAGRVFVERDPNGPNNPGGPDGLFNSLNDAGLGGVTVELRDASGTTLIATTTTAADGTYSFNNLPAGDYTVVELQPNGYGSYATSPNTVAVTLPPNGTATANFAEILSSISGQVFLDANNNGTVDGTESGISGVTVRITGTDVLNNPVDRVTTTGADGTYFFADLLQGTYTITETQPAGYTDGIDASGSVGGTVTAPDSVTNIALPAGTDATGYTFGETIPVTEGTGSIVGVVFYDRDRNMTQGTGETGLGNVTLRLRDSLGNVIATTTTGADGRYSFTALPPGTYTVEEIQPIEYGSSTPNSIGNILVTDGGLSSGNNFAETKGSLAGTVYFDNNNNGVQDAGEAGIAGVTVRLQGSSYLGTAENRTVVTDANGDYIFTEILGGTYSLTETQPAGIADGIDTVGTAGGIAGNDVVTTIGLGGGIDATEYNFGERPATLSGTVYVDADRDATRDTGEAGLAGVVVTLVDSNGVTVGTTTTDANGNYSFTNLVPGTYTVLETQPVGYGSSTPNGVPVTVPAAGLSGINFGETTATLSGRVFVDTNNSGLYNPGEPGIGGVTVTLTGTDDLGNAVNRTATTGADGTYNFNGLLSGSYTVTEAQPVSYTDGADAVGTVNSAPSGTNSSNDVFSGIGIGGGQDAINYNFGETIATPPGTGAITGTVYYDRNRDGIQDSGEGPIGGVTVELRDSGGTLVATTTTDANGNYVFTNLTPGTGYTVTELQPNGYGSSTPNVLVGIEVVADTLTAGVNFGETLSSVNGSVYVDANNNGTRDAGEAGIAGATVTLTGTDANNNPVNRTILTDANGNYTFGDLLSGSYTLTESQPAAYNDGQDSAGTFAGSVGNDVVSAITVPVGADGTGYNFGELGGSIQGTVYVDRNNNTTPDAGDVLIPGTTINLIDSNGNVVGTTTTQPDGTYTFTNLPFGDYTVVEVQPNGYGNVTPNTVPTTLTPGGPAVVDFIESLGSISGTVYHDRNNDGAIQAGEARIQGVTITLSGVDINGNTITPITTTTDVNGNYTFTDLLAGTYVIVETQAVNYLDGRETVGTAGGNPAVNDRISAIGLGAGNNETGYLFGERVPVNMQVTKTDNLNNVRPGQSYTYTIVVQNASLQDAEAVMVVDKLPKNVLTFVAASNGGVYDPAAGTVTWALGQVSGANAEIITLTVDVRVKGVIPAGVEFVDNRVEVSSSPEDPEETPDDNRARDRDGLIAAPDLYVVKTADLAQAKVGDLVTYTLTGGNAGNQVAADVIITDTLPPGVTFVSATLGGASSGTGVVWNLGDLAPGQTYSITVTVRVEAVASGQSLLNTVIISDKFGNFEDPTPDNNNSSAPTDVDTLPNDFTFAFDAFNNFALFRPGSLLEFGPYRNPTDVYRDPIIPIAPIYSGEADPGSTLVIELFNANGIRIGEQTVMVDAGGNWMATFNSAQIRDYPSMVRITELPAPYTAPGTAGRNLRNYFSPIISSGQFALGGQYTTTLDPRTQAPLLNSLNLTNPLQLGPVKFGGEVLPSAGAPGGY